MKSLPDYALIHLKGWKLIPTLLSTQYYKRNFPTVGLDLVSNPVTDLFLFQTKKGVSFTAKQEIRKSEFSE